MEQPIGRGRHTAEGQIEAIVHHTVRRQRGLPRHERIFQTSHHLHIADHRRSRVRIKDCHNNVIDSHVDHQGVRVAHGRPIHDPASEKLQEVWRCSHAHRFTTEILGGAADNGNTSGVRIHLTQASGGKEEGRSHATGDRAIFRDHRHIQGVGHIVHHGGEARSSVAPSGSRVESQLSRLQGQREGSRSCPEQPIQGRGHGPQISITGNPQAHALQQ